MPRLLRPGSVFAVCGTPPLRYHGRTLLRLEGFSPEGLEPLAALPQGILRLTKRAGGGAAGQRQETGKTLLAGYHSHSSDTRG
jgi:hypothetical protein